VRVTSASAFFLVFVSPFLFVFCRTRTTIERAFGVLVARFGIFWRPLKGSLATSVETIKACMIIHNIAIDEKEGELSGVPFVGRMAPGSVDPFVHFTDAAGGDNREGLRTDLEGESTRIRLTTEL